MASDKLDWIGDASRLRSDPFDLSSSAAFSFRVCAMRLVQLNEEMALQIARENHLEVLEIYK